MAKLEFVAENKTLTFDVSDGEVNWCTLYVVSQGNITKLGANSFDVIKEKMVSSLMPPYNTKKGVINDIEIEAFTVVNLMDSHASILAEPIKNSGLMLYLLPNNDFFPFMKLQKEDIDNLILGLTTFEG